MRGARAKSIRRYIKKRLPFLSEKPIYKMVGFRSLTVVLTELCQRREYQKVKRNFKKARTNNTLEWRKYNARSV